jgi:hypothetical protein
MFKTLTNCILVVALGASPLTMTSCTTDAYGNTAVTPEGAAAIGAGALIVGAMIGGATDSRHHHHHRGPGGPGPVPHPHPGGPHPGGPHPGGPGPMPF